MTARFDLIFAAAAAEVGHGIEPELLKAIAWRESSLDPSASRYGRAERRAYRKAYQRWRRHGVRFWLDHPLSERGDILWRSFGLMQVLYVVAVEVGYPVDADPEGLYDPEVNVRMGARHFRRCLNKAGNISSAISLYNAGRIQIDPATGHFPNQSYVDSVMRMRDRLMSANG